MPFGGEVKLTGESEYKKAIESITQDLGNMSSALQKQANDFSKNDSSMKNTAKQQKALNESLKQQETELAKAKTAYANYSVVLQTQQQRHKALSKEYNSAVKDLDKIGKECGETSEEYKKQQKVVEGLAKELGSSNEEINESKSAMSNLKKEISDSQKVIDGTKKEMTDLGDKTKKSGKDADDSKSAWERLSGVLGTVGKAMAVSIGAISAVAVGAGKKIWDLANDVSQAGDEIDKESQKLGISAESYQTLSYAMERSGADINDISKGMKTINKSLADTQNGVKGASKSFDVLGVSLKNSDGSMRSQEEVLLDSIDALSKMENETQRNALAQEIFGKSASELAPLLNSGSDGIHELMQEAKDYGMVMSDDAVKASATFQDSLTRMSGTLNGLKNNMIGGFLPSLTMIVDGFTDLVAGVDGAGEKIQKGVSDLLGNISGLIPKVVGLVSTIASAVLESAPTIIEALATGIIDAIPSIMPVINGLIGQLISMITTLIPQILGAGFDIVTALGEGITSAIPQLLEALPVIVDSILASFSEGFPRIVECGIGVLTALADGIGEAIPQLVSMMPELIDLVSSTLINELPKILDAGYNVLSALISGITKALPQLISMLPQIITTIVTVLTRNLPQILSMGVKLLGQLVSGIIKALPQLISAVGQLGMALLRELGKLPSKVIDVGKNLVKGLWNGIGNMTDWVIGKIKGFGDSVLGGIKKFFGIASPSKVMEKEVGVYLAQGIGQGFADEMQSVSRQMENAIPTSFDTQMNVIGNGGSGSLAYGYDQMVSAFKDALSQMKIELDDNEVGQFIDKTVTRLVYN